ncbi:MFS transporter [Nocardioides massiliensis]|uniref:MFS family permease n=1 Tax=Nocardioides massiliensis TaxID=1325935 RepID=A0ABT9NPV7_9ACTN|nr:MFS transporter [Nocardioides massiliensis]MDP9822462.1 MFS family permease [Nocardioides massiliensis]
MPALIAVTTTGFAGYAALLPVAPLWAVHGGAGSAGAGAVNGVLMLFTVLTQPFVPGAIRRLGWAPVLIAGLLLLGLPSLLLALSDGLVPVLLLSAVRGLGFGVLTVTGSAAVAELVEPARRGAAIGAYGLAIAGPQLVLIPLGPWLADTVDFRVMFAAGALPLLGCLPARRLGRHLHRDPQEPAVVGERQSRWPVYVRLMRPMALLLAVTLAGGALITFAAQMVSAAWMTMVGLALLTATAAISRWQAGGLADRYGARRFVWPLVLLTAVGLAITAYAVQDPDATDVGAFLVGMALVGVSYGGLQNLTLVLSFATVGRRDFGTASAVWNVGFDAGTGLGAVLVGAIAAGASFPTALLVAAGFSALTLPLAVRRTTPPPRGDG